MTSTATRRRQAGEHAHRAPRQRREQRRGAPGCPVGEHADGHDEQRSPSAAVADDDRREVGVGEVERVADLRREDAERGLVELVDEVQDEQQHQRRRRRAAGDAPRAAACTASRRRLRRATGSLCCVDGPGDSARGSSGSGRRPTRRVGDQARHVDAVAVGDDHAAGDRARRRAAATRPPGRQQQDDEHAEAAGEQPGRRCRLRQYSRPLRARRAPRRAAT